MEVSNLWRVHASKPQGDVLGFVDNIRTMSRCGFLKCCCYCIEVEGSPPCHVVSKSAGQHSS